MNKLSDAIRTARRRGNRTIGFGRRSSSDAVPKRGLLIGARGSARNGADIAIVLEAGAVGAAVESANGAPVGFAASELSREGVEQAEEAGVSFVVVDTATAPADVLLSEKLEYVFRLGEGEIDEAELRAIGSLQPTVVAVGEPISDPLSVKGLLALRRVVMLTGAPAGVRIDPSASVALLQGLRDSGVAVVALDEPSADDVEALRARIAEIPEVAQKRGRDAAPMVPGVVPGETEDDFED